MLTSFNSLARSRGDRATSAVTKPDAGHNVFPFLSLPAEIRNMIYEYSLVRGKVYTARKMPYHWKRQPKKQAMWLAYNSPKSHLPVVALLGINTHIRAEAQGVFYSQNTFVITLGDEDTESPLLPLKASVHFRSVELIFSCFDWNEQDLIEDYEGSIGFLPFSEEEAARRGRQEAFHDVRLEALLHEHWEFGSERYSYLSNSRLEHLTIDIEEAYCPTSCCRLAEVVVSDLRAWQWLHGLASNVEIIGAYDKLEHSNLREILDGKR